MTKAFFSVAKPVSD